MPSAAAKTEGDRIPLYLYALLLFPREISASLERVRAAKVADPMPNLWQIFMGVLYMWHRLAFRSETVGMSTSQPVRRTLRARLLQYRPIRFPFLLWEGAVAPLDFSGLASPPDRVIKHLLGAHHDKNQFVYDLEVLMCTHGLLEELHAAARAVVENDTPRSRWLRDLVVFERYHENLLEAVESAMRDGIVMSREDEQNPDISFRGYLRWCASQPGTPADTLRALREGRLSFAPTVPLPS